jgi:hypothetical protein
MRNVSDKNCRKNQDTHFMFNTIIFFTPKNRATYDMMWKNMVQPDRPQMTIKYSTEKMQQYRHTILIFNTYCFYTATMITQTHLNVTSHVHCPSSCFSVIENRNFDHNQHNTYISLKQHLFCRRYSFHSITKKFFYGLPS